MPTVFCNLEKQWNEVDKIAGCESCRKYVSINAPKSYFQDGEKRLAHREIYCVRELLEESLKDHPIMKRSSISIQVASGIAVENEE